MSAADEPLMPEIGTIEAARRAIEYVSISLGQARPAGKRVESVNDELDSDVADVIVTLANLSATLTRTCAILIHGRGNSSPAAEQALLQKIADDQEVRAARYRLEDLGDGFPFNA